MAATVTAIVVDCDTGVVTITGTNFEDGAAIDLQDPFAQSVAFDLLSLTTSQIVLQLAGVGAQGQYCASVFNQTLVQPGVPPGSFLFNGTD